MLFTDTVLSHLREEFAKAPLSSLPTKKRLARRGRKKNKLPLPKSAPLPTTVPQSPEYPAPVPYIPPELSESILVFRIAAIRHSAKLQRVAAQMVFDHAGPTHKDSALRTLAQQVRPIDAVLMQQLSKVINVTAALPAFSKVITVPLAHVSGHCSKGSSAVQLLTLHAIFKNNPDGQVQINCTRHQIMLRAKMSMSSLVAFESACKIGNLEVAKWWWSWFTTGGGQHEPPPTVSHDVLVAIAKNGHTAMLDWFRSVGLFPTEYAEGVLYSAAGAGQLQVLSWWYARSLSHVPRGERLHFKYSHKAVGLASARGHLHVLNWFLEKVHPAKETDKKLKFKRTARTLAWAEREEWPAESIAWWKEHNLML